MMKDLGTDALVVKTADGDHGIITNRDIIDILEKILQTKSNNDAISQVEGQVDSLASPLTQSILKLLSDMGI